MRSRTEHAHEGAKQQFVKALFLRMGAADNAFNLLTQGRMLLQFAERRLLALENGVVSQRLAQRTVQRGLSDAGLAVIDAFK